MSPPPGPGPAHGRRGLGTQLLPGPPRCTTARSGLRHGAVLSPAVTQGEGRGVRKVLGTVFCSYGCGGALPPGHGVPRCVWAAERAAGVHVSVRVCVCMVC